MDEASFLTRVEFEAMNPEVQLKYCNLLLALSSATALDSDLNEHLRAIWSWIDPEAADDFDWHQRWKYVEEFFDAWLRVAEDESLHDAERNRAIARLEQMLPILEYKRDIDALTETSTDGPLGES